MTSPRKIGFPRTMTVIEALLYTVWLVSALLRPVLTLFSAVRPLTALLRPLSDPLPQLTALLRPLPDPLPRSLPLYCGRSPIYCRRQVTALLSLLWPLSDPTAGYACEKYAGYGTTALLRPLSAAALRTTATAFRSTAAAFRNTAAAFRNTAAAFRSTAAAPRRCRTVFAAECTYGLPYMSVVPQCCSCRPCILSPNCNCARKGSRIICKALKYSHVALNLKGIVSIVFISRMLLTLKTALP